MIFNSTAYLIFFPAVVVLFYLFPHKSRWILLLLASAVFYGAFIPAYLMVFALLIFIDFTAGILIENSTDKHRKLFLGFSVIANLGLLGFFKYFNFFADNLNSLADFLGWNYSIELLSIILPIGLSFHTFQALAYTIEVYRGRQKAERHLGIYALYVMFFPQLVSGPIERPQNMLHQYREKKYFGYEKVKSGLRLMLIGFFKKVVIADQAAIFVNLVYDHPLEYQGVPLILATILFAFQIYGDFSGYSDIAQGSARVLGFELMTNFRSPYLAPSISEFWRRWHISLSTWFRDFVYFPMGGSRVAKARWRLNVLIVFTLSGFWHGANWTFILWGALHGFYIIVSELTENLREKIAEISGAAKFPRANKIFQILFTFSLVSVAWILFRAHNISEAWYIFTHFFSGLSELIANPNLLVHSIPDFNKRDLILVFLSILLLKTYPIIESFLRRQVWLGKKRSFAGYYLLIFWMLYFGAFIKQQFIYFQF